MTKSSEILSFIPAVFESSGRTERHTDLLSQMFQNRTIFFFGEVNNETTRTLCAQLMYLYTEDSTREITLLINSVGGSLYDAIAIVDTMRRISNPISTWVMGQAFSAGSLISAAGTKGRRRVTENSTLMIHQPSGGTRGTAADMLKTTKEIERMHELVVNLLQEFTGLSSERLSDMIQRDYYMSAQQAKELCFVDDVILSYNKMPQNS